MNKRSVEFSQVSFSYSSNLVLENISFSIDRGDYAGLVGGNGGGKTTLLRLMLGLVKSQSGNVTLFGEDILSFRDWHRIGYVPQHVSRGDLSFATTVSEVVESGLISNRISFFRSQRQGIDRAREAMEIAGVTNLAHRCISTLSGGERQLVFIARALAARPELLVLDEPTTGVDSESQARFYALLSTLNQEKGMTIILVSHDLEVVAREVRTVICINRKLICNVGAKAFVEGDYLHKIYGDDMKYIHHHHHD